MSDGSQLFTAHWDAGARPICPTANDPSRYTTAWMESSAYDYRLHMHLHQDKHDACYDALHHQTKGAFTLRYSAFGIGVQALVPTVVVVYTLL